MDPILENLTEFATGMSYRDLPASVVSAAGERVMDALGCAVGAYDGDTVRIARSLAGPAAPGALAGRLVGSRSTAAADAAGFVNTCMVRNIDFNDTYLPGGHPSDSSGGLFAIAPQIGASGQRLIAATVVAYEIFIRLQISAKLREKGWDQGFGVGIGTAAGLANLMGLSRDVARNAIAITCVANVPMRATRAGQLSMWKGVATAYAVRNAVFGVELAMAGMSAPEAPFSGRHGFTDLISGPIELALFGTKPENFFLPKAKIKYWPVAHAMQTAIWAGIELRKKVAADQLASVDVQTCWSAWHESGSEPAKWDPTTKETADHSLPYILAWTLRHGQIDEESFEPESYLDPSIRPLMNIITARVDDDIEKDMPKTIRMRLNAKDKAGKSYEVHIVNPPGHEDNPLSPADLAAKFTRLCEPRLGKARTAAALKQWQNIASAVNVKDAFDAVDVSAAR
ncbi:MAG: MmgE/PrpD family protein [Burkholderiales bacterium]